MCTEHFPFAMLAQMVQPGHIVYDIGANIGLYCRYLTSALQAGKVYAFEPWQENLSILRRNLELGAVVSRVDIVEAAVTDRNGQATFQIDDMQSTSGTLDSVTHGLASEGRQNLRLPPVTVTVACCTLDTLIDEQQLPVPHLLKVDVEGAEVLVLAGARNLLHQPNVRFLIELHGPEQARGVAEILLDAGYWCMGRVAPTIDPSGYSNIDFSVLERIKGRYDVQYIVAAKSDSNLPSTYEAPKQNAIHPVRCTRQRLVTDERPGT